MQIEVFPLAPMSRSIALLTGALFLLPMSFVYLGARGNGNLLSIPGAGLLALYLLVWLYFRPNRFEISGSALTVVWPIRRFELPLADIERAEVVSGQEFKARYGWGMRVGAGGLWGGFGLLVTKKGTLRFYISRLDGFVLIHSRSERPLLITPERPAEFCRLLCRQVTLGPEA